VCSPISRTYAGAAATQKDVAEEPSKPRRKLLQPWVSDSLTALFPKVPIVEEYELVDDKTKQSTILDVYVPSMKLAFDYQSQQRYAREGVFGNVTLRLERDEEKEAACKAKGITLITVPFWWDREHDSLAATIFEKRPDLKNEFKDVAARTKKERAIPEIANTTISRWTINDTVPLMFAAKFPDRKDPTGWWLSEKLDGVRGYWDGNRMVARTGAEIKLPPKFRALLPKDVHLDGEFMTGRNEFTNTVTALYRRVEGGWGNMTYHIFDLVDTELPWEERYARLQKLYPTAKDSGGDGRIVVLEQFKCKDEKQYKAFCEEIVSKGGEGVMLRKPGSLYTKGGRTQDLSKWKPFLDTEVMVLGPHKKLNFRGLVCQLPNGQQTTVKCSLWDYENPPPRGTVVTVKYGGEYETTGKLKHGILLRIRRDMTWEDVLKNQKIKNSDN
jgi:DNA ligase-1